MSLLILDSVFRYEGESLSLFSAMTTQPNDTRKRAINKFIKRLKDNGTWNLLDTLWVMAAHDQQASRLNWKSPGTYTLTEVNSPTWTLDQGYTGNGSSMYLDTGFNPSSNGVNFILNSGCLSVYCRTNVSESLNMAGSNDGTQAILISGRNATNTATGRVNCNTNASAASTDSRGFWSVVRTASNAQAIFKNGSSVVTDGTASSAIPNLALYILAINSSGSPAQYGTRQLSVAGVGSGSISQSDFSNAIEEYMDAIGSGVI